MVADRTRIAILGATSHIAKSLIGLFLSDQGYSLHLYTRSQEGLRPYLNGIRGDFTVMEGYQRFFEESYDAVLNCIGVGTRKKLQGRFYHYFTVTEQFDNMVLDYLNRHLDTLYLTLSSGAVYGRGFAAPVTEHSEFRICVNDIAPEDYYSIARLNAEAKHRAFKDLRIVDLRVFSYFSRYIDLADGYFITDLMESILNGCTLTTGSANIMRDYVHPEDLFSIITKCIHTDGLNCAFDVRSAAPVSKEEILAHFSKKYGLKYMTGDASGISPTGSKDIYCSDFRNAEKIGYFPRYSSMETIMLEAEYILNRN